MVSQRGCRYNARPHAALRFHHLRQRVSAVSGPAGDGQADPAVVRRVRRGVDHLPRVLPDHASARLRLRRPDRAPPVARLPSRRPYRAAGGQLPGVADRTRRPMEAARHRESVHADPRAAGGNHRTALSVAVDDEPAGAGVVRPQLSGSQSVPPVRAVEPRVDAGVDRLPLRSRTLGRDAPAILRLVGGVRAVRGAVHRVRLV